ncbi:MAG: hypothetical protein RL264_2424 [Bacteroidota bacterium]|jgi:gliding motility-associated-like protein
MKIKAPKIAFNLYTSIFFLTATLFVFGQQQMKPGKSNFTTFSSSKVNNLQDWRSLNSEEYWSHPEFGTLPDDAPCTSCVEILSKRKEDERYFVDISDRKIVYNQKALGALHYRENNLWRRIDMRLKQQSNGIYAATQQFDPTQINSEEGFTAINTPYGNFKFNTWKLYGLRNGQKEFLSEANWSSKTVGDDGMIVFNYFPGIDLKLEVYRGRIKSSFVVHHNYFQDFSTLCFQDEVNNENGQTPILHFEDGTVNGRQLSEITVKQGMEDALYIGQAFVFSEGDEKNHSLAEYEIQNNKYQIIIPKNLIQNSLDLGKKFIIDPTVTSSNTLAQASIAGSGYNATCFNGFCSYNLSVPTPANATVTNVQWTFNYIATSPCWMSDGANTFYLGTCRSPNQTNLFWFCNNNSSGTCNGNAISIFSDVSSCLPAPSCTPQNLNFTMRFHRCYTSGGCSNSCIGANSPWTMTITGRTLEYTNATPITLSATTICAGQSVTASTASTFGIPAYTYNWSLSAGMTPSVGTTSSVSIPFPTAGSYTIYNTVTDQCGTVVNSSRTITVNASPIITATPSPQTICSGQGTGLSLSSSMASTSYSWTVVQNGVTGATNGSGTGTGATSTLSINQTLTNSGATPGTATYTITPTASGCTGTPITVVVTVNPVATVTNPGNQTVCAGQSTSAVTFTGTNGATFNWTNNNTATGLGASGTGNIASFVGTNSTGTAITSTITVTPSYGSCPGTPQSFTITVSPLPTVNVISSQTVCAGQATTAVTFSGTATTYNWSNSNTTIGLGASGTGNITSFTATNTSTSPITGTITVTPVIGTCTGTSQTFDITVNPSPVLTVPSNQSLCAGQQTTAITFTSSPTATVNWTNDNTGTGLSANGVGDIAAFTATNSTGATIVSTITATPTLNGCNGTPITFTITVNVTPIVSSVSSQTVCAGQLSTLITFAGTATTYTWANSNPSIGLGLNGTGNINPFTATNTTALPISGTIVVTPSSGNCVGTPTTFTITVNPSPSITAPSNQTICAGQTTTSVTFSTIPTSTVNWSNDNTASGLGASGTGNIGPFTGINATSSPIISTITATPTANGCLGTPAVFTITVNPTPTMTAPADQTVCAGQLTSAVAYTSNGTSFSWTNNNTAIGLGASGTGTINAFTATNTSTISITGAITVTPSIGSCNGTPVTFNITVNPTVTLTPPSNQNVCAGQTTSAVNFTTTPSGSVSWTNDNTATGLAASGNGNIASFTATNTTSSPITSTITATPSANGCTGAPVTFTITVSLTPTVNAVTSQTVCAGQQTTAVTFSGTGTSYGWTNSNAAIGLGANGIGNIPAFTATNTGTSPISGTISVIPTIGTCVGNPITFTITVNPNLTPTFTQIGPLCQGATAPTLSTSSTNNPPIIGTWNPSTVSTATVGSTTITFTPNAGTCATTATMTIQITAPTVPAFTQLGPYCVNGNVPTLPTNSTNSPAITGTWNPSTISTITAGTTTYTFTPSANQCAVNATMSITVTANPTIGLTAQTICAGQSVTLIPTVSPSGGTYLWSNNQTGSSITVSPTQTTNYSVLYTVNGCTANTSTSVTVNPNVTPTFTNLGPYCKNETPGNLSTTSTNGITGTWNPSTISTTTAGNQTYTFTPTAGICATTYSMTVLVNAPQTPNFANLGPYCEGTVPGNLANSSTNGINGTWNPSTINTTTAGNFNFIFTPNAGLCATPTSMNVVINPTPIATFITDKTQGCSPLSVTLTATSNAAGTYNWTANNATLGTGNPLSTTLSAGGCYTIGLTVTQNGCSASSSQSSLICVESAPNVYFTAFPNSIMSSNQTVTFNSMNNASLSYSWNFGDGGTSTDMNPTHNYNNVNSNMTVTLTASTPLGCTGTYSITLPYKDETTFYVPNSFTPDEDQFNQTWGPVFTKGFDPYNFSLYIYNRWGELIWESHDATAKWDGTYGLKGIKAPSGIYTWKIEYKPLDTDEKLFVKGHLNLLR